MMKARHILFNTSWDEFDMGTCKFDVKFFDQFIPFFLFQDHKPKPALTEKMIVAINNIMVLDAKKQDLYFQEFGENSEIKVREIHIDQEHDGLDGVYSEIIMDMPTSEYMSLIVKDGQIVHLDKDGTYLESLKIKK
ncbi:MAG: Unknown protein [uncultured Sulfurovum sp.]|uniref:Uncharacterized protein n=1 Tax=uncultured Sulfurovum sp. TaxID=269237 RepID=A0A6S6SX19_9BACT|nr:MAG: Unknown protein [uncultured Sulfurovum sp.]